MNAKESSARDLAGVFAIERTFDAPRDLVWKAHAEEQRLRQWWGPKGAEITECSLDFRLGGVFRFGLRMPNGLEMRAQWVFREIVPQEKIVYVSSFIDAEGNITRAPFFDPWPLTILTTVTFTERDATTTLSLASVPIDATDAERAMFEKQIPSMRGGWGGTFDQLDAYVLGSPDREIVQERTYDAPASLVWEALTKPEHLTHWWGPNGFSTTTDSMDVRVGGTWVFTMHGPDGRDWPNHVTYLFVDKPRRLVYLHGADDDDDVNKFHATITLDENGGQTTVKLRLLTATAEYREEKAKFGAVEGGRQTLARLAEYLPAMKD